jgi:hypothetical protein
MDGDGNSKDDDWSRDEKPCPAEASGREAEEDADKCPLENSYEARVGQPCDGSVFGADYKPVVWEDNGLPEDEQGESSLADGREGMRIRRNRSLHQVRHQRWYRDGGEEGGRGTDER